MQCRVLTSAWVCACVRVFAVAGDVKCDEWVLLTRGTSFIRSSVCGVSAALCSWEQGECCGVVFEARLCLKTTAVVMMTVLVVFVRP